MFNVKVTFLDQISRAVSQQMNEGHFAEPFVHFRSDFIARAASDIRALDLTFNPDGLLEYRG